MKQKKLNSILIFTSLFSVLMFLISLKFNSAGNFKTVESALLNPSAKNNISSVEIVVNEEKIFLFKKNGTWFFQKDDILTFCDENKCENLLNELSKIRKIIKFMDKNSASLQEYKKNLTNKITIFQENGKVLSNLEFSFPVTLTSSILVSSSKGNIIWETKDDFSPFFDVTADFWVKSEIFFAVKNPSSIHLNSAEFYELSNLRHGKVKSVFEKQNSTLIYRILIKGQLDDFQILEIFEESGNPDGKKNYYYSQEVFPCPFEEKAVFEISSYTLDSIVKLLKLQKINL